MGANTLVACTTTTGTRPLYEGRNLFERFRETTEEIVHYQSQLDDQRQSHQPPVPPRTERRKHAQDALVRDLVERLYEEGW